jgi:hypothetical protein
LRGDGSSQTGQKHQHCAATPQLPQQNILHCADILTEVSAPKRHLDKKSSNVAACGLPAGSIYVEDSGESGDSAL